MVIIVNRDDKQKKIIEWIIALSGTYLTYSELKDKLDRLSSYDLSNLYDVVCYKEI